MAQENALSHLLLQTPDLARAEAFYVNILGFHVKERTTFADGRPLIILRERMGLTELRGERSAHGQAVEHIAFQVPDIQAVLRSLRTHHVTIEEGPKPTSYGTSVYFRDPDGNRIECHD